MTITLRISEDDSRAIRDYARIHGMSVSEFMRRAAMDKIEDEIDLEIAMQALSEHEANPATFSHDEVGRMLGVKEGRP